MTTHPTDAEIAEIEQRLKQYGWTEGFMSLCAAARDRNRLEALAKSLSDALLKVRPLGGSELFRRSEDRFYADPEYCGAEIERMRRELHESRCETVRLRKSKLAMEAENAKLREAIEKIDAEVLQVNGAIIALQLNQRQLDQDGVEVGVSRQAADECVSALNNIMLESRALSQLETDNG